MINVCDAIMGSGKSSAAIAYMNAHSDQHFIYITPYLDEASRIKEACPALRFVEPSKGIAECGFTKGGHTLKLLEAGRNIATTHQAFTFYTQKTLDIIKQKDYTLIIDENVDSLQECDCDPGDIDLLVKAGCAVKTDEKYTLTEEPYTGRALARAMRLMHSWDLIRFCDSKGLEMTFYWQIPPELLTSFKNVFILTYLFEAQSLHHLLKIYDIPYRHIGITCTDGVYAFSSERSDIPQYTGDLSSHIHICEHTKLNRIGEARHSLSMNWFKTHIEEVDTLRCNLYNFFRHLNTDKSADERMWGTYSAQRMALRGRGYSNGFVVFNEKATNQYRNRRVLAYAVNIFMNGMQKHFFEQHGVKVSDDLYALSNMVQWIWRSAIRDGQDIWIYIPSKRMRTLLVNWIEDTERKYHEYEQEKAVAE